MQCGPSTVCKAVNGFIAYLIADPDPQPCAAMADAEKWEEAKDAGAVRRHGAVKRKKVHTANNHKFIARSDTSPVHPPHTHLSSLRHPCHLTDQSHVLVVMITGVTCVNSEMHTSSHVGLSSHVRMLTL